MGQSSNVLSGPGSGLPAHTDGSSFGAQQAKGNTSSTKDRTNSSLIMTSRCHGSHHSLASCFACCVVGANVVDVACTRPSYPCPCLHAPSCPESHRVWSAEHMTTLRTRCESATRSPPLLPHTGSHTHSPTFTLSSIQRTQLIQKLSSSWDSWHEHLEQPDEQTGLPAWHGGSFPVWSRGDRDTASGRIVAPTRGFHLPISVHGYPACR